MTTLTRLVLLSALLVPATGCFFVEGDDGDDQPVNPDAGVDPDANVPDTGAIEFTWNLVDAGAAANCPAGATDATLVSQPAGGGSPYLDIYDCADGTGVASDLPIGDYTIWVEIGNGTAVAAQSEAASVTVDGGELVQAVFDIDVANGFFDVSWTIAGSSCAATSAGGTSVLSTLSGTTTGLDDVFDCAAGEAPAIATTAELPIGAYVVAISLLNQADQAIGDAAPLQPSITFGNEYVDLGTVTINLF